MTTGMTHIFSLNGDGRVYSRNEISRSMSTPELSSLENAAPAVRLDEHPIGTPVVEARPVEIEYFCCFCSRVKEIPQASWL
tara:strand:- start:1778 stop:2020 length:243 start_codon:yes stop_codon:yes gene_type:complete